jgi:hypothetical protein
MSRSSAASAVEISVRIVAAIVAILAAAHVLLYFDIARRTLDYPYPLNWIEGGTLDVVARVRDGLPLYVRPTVDYVPYIYTPLYYWATAGVALVTGLDFFAARLVSFAAIVGATLIVWLFVRREGGDRLAALTAVGLFIGTYDAVARYFHIARVDSLFLFLLLAGFYSLRFGKGWPSAILSGVLLYLSFMTKQSAILCAAAALPVMAIGSWRRPLIAGSLLVFLVVATNLLMDVRTDGWWSYFVWDLPRGHDWSKRRVLVFWLSDLGATMPLAVIGSVALLAGLARHDRQRCIWFLGLLGSTVAVSCLSRAHPVSSGNVLMPAYAALAIAMPLGLARVARTASLRLAVALALAAQLAMLIHRVGPSVPTPADRAAGDWFVTFLRGIEGEVIIFDQRFVETRAGKKSWGLEEAANEIFVSAEVTARDNLRAQIIAEVSSGRVAGVIDPPMFLLNAVKFGPPVRIFDRDDVFWTVAGPAKRPSRYYAMLR